MNEKLPIQKLLSEGMFRTAHVIRGNFIADAVHPGGSAAIKKCGWPLPGQVKHEWAEKVGPLMDPERNISPSFGKLRDGLRRLVAEAA